MRKIVLFILASMVSFSLYSQEKKQDYEMKTLLGKNLSHGGYFGMSFGYAQVNNSNALIGGAKLAWVINHSFALGFAGNCFANNISFSTSETDKDYYMTGYYGGMFFEPIIGSKMPVHLTFPVVFGVGSAQLNQAYYNGANPWESYKTSEDFFAFVEPGVAVELNLLKWFRVSGGFNYRFTSDVVLGSLSPNALNGLSATVSLKFGKF